MRYAGEYHDAQTGFYYLRARYYDPATQQFLTRDPLVAATEQAYNYANGSWTPLAGGMSARTTHEYGAINRAATQTGVESGPGLSGRMGAGRAGRGRRQSDAVV